MVVDADFPRSDERSVGWNSADLGSREGVCACEDLEVEGRDDEGEK